MVAILDLESYACNYIVIDCIFESYTPKNMVLDTKIVTLAPLLTKIWHSLNAGSHLGGHLEFDPFAMHETSLPSLKFKVG